MPTLPVDYPVLVSQLPFVSKLATAEQTRPEVRQEVFGPLITQELQKQAKEEVPVISSSEKNLAVDRDGKGNSQTPQSQQQDQHAAQDPQKEEMDSHPGNDSPWAGNLINKRI